MTDSEKIAALREALLRLLNAGDSRELQDADANAKRILEQTK